MENAPMTAAPRAFPGVGVRLWAGTWFATLCLWASASGCGPAEPSSEPLPMDSQSQELDSSNGLSANGLSANGLSANGLSANGLSANGLSTATFKQWFNQDPAMADMLMTYVVRCAVPAGQTRSYTHSQTGKTYTWAGGLGLALDWANGHPANYNEQQVVTACLLAHVNRYGVHVTISVLGWNAWGNAIPFTTSELASYSVREACFFGNLFTPNSLFFGVDRPVQDQGEYLTRACGALDSGADSSTQCAPLRFVGRCSQFCLPSINPAFYSSCVYNGVSYRPITTRMKQSDYNQLFPD
ncbi:hypothetical protein [Hyalangium versicolor]|uniref:hypothetical protein n=1 Tax=Hyalangium versicolor TaxID=2861190 RepID=UPI001CCB9BB7|nr:hypothetical protein [Hyalangium versicolor]